MATFQIGPIHHHLAATSRWIQQLQGQHLDVLILLAPKQIPTGQELTCRDLELVIQEHDEKNK